MGSSSWNDARQTNSPCLTVSNPALAGTPSYGTCITESYQKGIGVEPLVNPFGAVGTPSGVLADPSVQSAGALRPDDQRLQDVGDGRRQPRRRHVQ